MDTKDGGSACPQIDSEDNPDRHEYTGNVYSAGGMSLRDYFAGQAIVAYWMPSGKHETHGDCSDAADFAYGMADAMMKAREKA